MATHRPQPSMPPISANGNDLTTAISHHLASKNVRPTQAWLNSFTPAVGPNTPLIALQKTALFRILATDLTTTTSPAAPSCFPAGVANPEVAEQRLPGPITVQVLDVEDVGRSRWSQVEAIEAQERGEFTKGREVIRVVADDGVGEGAAPNSTTTTTTTMASNNPYGAKSSGPHKLLLQDAKGTKAYAMELSPVAGVNVQMSIGAKLVLRNVVVARGLLLLEGGDVEVLGGKVEAWDKKWREGRKGVLKARVGVSAEGV